MQAKIYKWSGWIKETRADVLFSMCKSKMLECGFKIKDEATAFFSPQGFTALFLLAESHFAIHTFPEKNITYLELSSCCKRQYEAWVTEAQEMDPIDCQISISGEI